MKVASNCITQGRSGLSNGCSWSMAEAVLWNEAWLGPTAGKESRMHQREEGANKTGGGKRAV